MHLQTADEPPAFIMVKREGWLMGFTKVLEQVNDPSAADDINPSSYKYRVNFSMEIGDERYTYLGTADHVEEDLLILRCHVSKRSRERIQLARAPATHGHADSLEP
ncbi:hypothetical protein N7526_002006 [Penicillium atrosanguineum]|nr:hypothetical protein N7526_002006 [Penicillium atrosanguineum]